MTLSRALSQTTDSKIRARGAEYFSSGAVVHFDATAELVFAVVRGSDDYVIRLRLDDRDVEGTCTCPYFTDRLEICKHLWAVVLKCDAQGVLQPNGPDVADAVDFFPIPLDDEDAGLDLDDFEFREPSMVRREGRRARAPKIEPWQQALLAIAQTAAADLSRPAPPLGQLLYVIDLAASRQNSSFVVHLLRREQKQNGEWGVSKPARLHSSQVSALPDADRVLVEKLGGAKPAYSPVWHTYGTDIPSPVHLVGAVALDLLPLMCRSGRCFVAQTAVSSMRPQDSPLEPVAWQDETFRASLEIARDNRTDTYTVDGSLTAEGVRVPASRVQLLIDSIAVLPGVAGRMEPGYLTPWLQQLMARGALRVPVAQATQLRDALLMSGVADLPDLPEELRTSVIDVTPVPHLALRTHAGNDRQIVANLFVSYDAGPLIDPAQRSVLAQTRDPRSLARRRPDLEQAAEQRLRALGVRNSWVTWEGRSVPSITPPELPRVVHALVQEGWHVEADGRRYRLATSMPAFSVRTGIDWFELHGSISFGDAQVPLPALLEAATQAHASVVLDDGTYGILPEDWLKQVAPLALGTRDSDHVRFSASQVGLLDALLAARPVVSWDTRAAAARDRLRAFDRVGPLDAPPGFQGTLRDYQRDALGWLYFLREFGFGGCLADDMGLGKTVVVLALLEGRRQERERDGRAAQPSLVVVPRSVLFNWQQEAARFAPGLRVLDFSGTGRTERQHLIAESDLVLVTYGTLRRDAAALADVAFDYVILDEAQTIKNANTAAAKAARLLRGTHRLALSGTPVENRLDDLWSLFEFLNPGLLSGATSFGRSFGGDTGADELQVLARGLRPFILRRTKEQVATELPAKTEQTIVCDLERPQRALYNELRDHYRRQLLGTGSSWQRSKIQVLEALLRLRQAACHPALVDPKRKKDASAKLDLLLPRLIETIAEGHKALVFSQFTSFLALLRAQLDARHIEYEYLDGQTRDREARVEHFQTDDSCRLFLISLKAGGVGLNLTAADYVFILDPWWNPAAEAQAVDRTHRIGQTRNVFAYRLIARDTVEERVLELQQRKRELADAIITADNSVVRGLKREDLELLLS